ncbi:DMT family transporter [Intrasporangium calvum]|uniref:DMT family transporter n=1 Tax=Intrasporangium calvum TaxID=53358 RepID=A0ABT5GF64_9MICO|nr:DMT family transporter [Intrasporangium calvum]MDC5696525.1 DMT family transporter [Intrasporangium calvum]
MALLFLGVGLSWGASFLFIKVAVQGVSPVQLVLARTTLATLVLAVVMVLTKRRWPSGALAWRRILVLGVVGCAVPFLLYAWAGQRIPSGLSSIYNASVPVSTTVLTVVAMRQETIRGRSVAGVVLGALGILIVLAPWRLGAESFDLAGQVACVGAVIGLGFAFAYTKKSLSPLRLDPVGIAFGQMLVAAALMILIAPFTALTPVTLDLPITLSILLLSVLGTGFAYVWNFRVIDSWGAAPASMVTYVTTLVGVGLGISVLGEPLTLNQLLGALVVLGGVALGVSRPRVTPGTGVPASSSAQASSQPGSGSSI